MFLDYSLLIISQTLGYFDIAKWRTGIHCSESFWRLDTNVIVSKPCGELSLFVQYATTCTFGPAQSCNSKKNLKDLVKK